MQPYIHISIYHSHAHSFVLLRLDPLALSLASVVPASSFARTANFTLTLASSFFPTSFLRTQLVCPVVVYTMGERADRREWRSSDPKLK